MYEKKTYFVSPILCQDSFDFKPNGSIWLWLLLKLKQVIGYRMTNTFRNTTDSETSTSFRTVLKKLFHMTLRDKRNFSEIVQVTG